MFPILRCKCRQSTGGRRKSSSNRTTSHFAVRTNRSADGARFLAHGRSNVMPLVEVPLFSVDSICTPVSRNLISLASLSATIACAAGLDHRLRGSFCRCLALLTTFSSSRLEQRSQTTPGSSCSCEYNRIRFWIEGVRFFSSSFNAEIRDRGSVWNGIGRTEGLYPHSRHSLVEAVEPLNGSSGQSLGNGLESSPLSLTSSCSVRCGSRRSLRPMRSATASMAVMSDVKSSWASCCAAPLYISSRDAMILWTRIASPVSPFTIV
mmetsp:Transcript_17910/g.43839  ORF Transcript_17910/g.43839 Transcript_17910/m.43839 type:complete len:264 (-) Transcript_17910:389-1180(-)